MIDILNLLKSPESKSLEFKQDLSSPLKVLRTIVAFANTSGGILVIGVEDKTKHIHGIKEPLLLEEKITNLINDLISPQLLPEIEIVSLRNLYLLVIQVFPSPVRPHYLKKEGPQNGTYIRSGSSNRQADTAMQAELNRLKTGGSFDRQPMIELNSEAIDFRVISELFADFKKPKQNDLESLDLLTRHQGKKIPTIGSILLFGKNRLNYFPDAWIQAGRFSGSNKSNIVDTKDIHSYPILAIDEALVFVKKHAMQSITIPGTKTTTSLSRHQKTWSFPLTAIREAIINAVVHADYAQSGAPIRLSLFDDRIEIENPGLLPFGLTLNDIMRGVSKLRNRVIGQIFYRLGLIERWGSGIERIFCSCKEAGFPEPIFEEIGTHFRVTLFIQPLKNPGALNETDTAIVNTLKNKDGLSTKEIAEKIGKSQRLTRTRLIHLIEKDLVKEVGSSLNDPHKKYFLSTFDWAGYHELLENKNYD